MEDNFDKHIRERLQKLGEDTLPGDWSSFEEKLNADPDLGSGNSEDRLFDDAISGKLENMDVPLNPSHWEMMDAKLDAEVGSTELEDVYLDGVVYDNLHNLNIPYNRAHWTLMSHRLDEEFSFHRKLIKYKVTEVVLMLMIIFTFLQYLPFDKQSKSVERVAIESKAGPVIQPTTENHLINQLENNKNEISTAPDAVVKSSIEKNNIETIALKDIVAPVASSKVVEKKLVNDIPRKLSGGKNITLLSVPQKELPAITINDKANERAKKYNKNVEKPKGITNYKLDGSLNIIEDIQTVPMEALLYDRNFEEPDCNLCKIRPSAKFRMGMFLSGNLNYITTPERFYNFDNQIKIPVSHQISGGYGGGVTIGFKYRKWEITTGITYANVSFSPSNSTVFTTGNFEEGYVDHELTSTKINQLSIPFDLYYTINDAGKWHLYALGGTSLNILALNQFTVQTTSNEQPVTSSVEPEGTQTADTRSPIDYNSTYAGLFEGGEFQNNHYFTANIGIGIERYLTPQWSIFIQPYYQHKILSKKGFGPVNDRFQTLFIQLGAKSTLK